jgi:beta-glucosidase
MKTKKPSTKKKTQTQMKFPRGFIWGTATSSYQIEGAATEDGRGTSIWDVFAATPSKIKDNSDGKVACDHYHRYKDDVALMKSLGVHAYRFSIAWPRILPDGAGRVEPRGLDFYSRLVDELLSKNITPFVTLYHWDLPQALQDKGGWNNRDIVGWFADYAAIVIRALGDRVKNWITLNEPWCIAFLSNEIGAHAPGNRDPKLARQIAHHCNLAHGAAMQAIRASSQNPCNVGITLNYAQIMPVSESDTDKRAAETAQAYDPFHAWFSLPILTGQYGNEVMAMSGENAPKILPGDMALISQRLDFLGVNYYSPARVRDNNGVPEHLGFGTPDPREVDRTLMGWEVEPKGLYLLLHQLHHDSQGKVPLFITENGCSYADTVSADGKVHDSKRVSYLREHFKAAQRAIKYGIDLRGYFVWSLLDNYEWNEGYQQFFGIVRVDYKTQKRIIKDSGFYLRDVIKANAV